MFENLTIDKIQTALALSVTQIAGLAYYNGDPWQAGAGYVGPKPPATDPNYTRVISEIQRGFVGKDIIGEIADRHANGVVGRDVVWDVARADDLDPTPDDEARIAEAEALLRTWIDRTGAQDTIDRAVATMTIAGRAGLRILIPPGRRDEAGTVPAGAMDQQLRHIYLDHPAPDEIGIITDADTRHVAGVYAYQDDAGQSHAEIVFRDPDNPDAIIWRILTGQGENAEPAIYYLPMAGDTIPIYEMSRRPLVSSQVLSQQRLYNLAATMKARNVVLGGFLERTLLNAQLVGEEKVINGQKVFVPSPLAFGPGVVNSIVGIKDADGSGGAKRSTPEIQYRDPVPVDTFEATERAAYLAILGEAHQLHYAIAGDATPSGEARIAAMADYVIDLLKTKKRVDDAWKWIGVTALNLAATLAGEPNKWAGLTIKADAQIDAGPVSPEMMRATAEMVRDRLLSQETGRSWIGVTDTKAEAQRVDDEQSAGALGAIDQINQILAIDSAAQTGQAQAGQAGA